MTVNYYLLNYLFCLFYTIYTYNSLLVFRKENHQPEGHAQCFLKDTKDDEANINFYGGNFNSNENRDKQRNMHNKEI